MTTIAPARGVIERIAAHRTEYAALADELAEQLDAGPTLAELSEAEDELLDRLAALRRRATARAELEHAHRQAAEVADQLGALIGATQDRMAPTPPEQALAETGLLRPRPQPDPLAGPPGIVRDARGEVAAATGGHPAPVPAVPGRGVATTGPGATVPDPSAVPPATPAEPPAQGPRHKRERGRR